MLIFSLSVQYSLKLVALNLQSVIILCSGRRDSIKSVMSSVRFYQHIIKLVSASRQMPSILTNLESLAWRIWFPESLLGTSLYKCHNVSCTDINLKYTKLCCVFSFFTHCGTLLNTIEHYWTLLNKVVLLQSKCTRPTLSGKTGSANQICENSTCWVHQRTSSQFFKSVLKQQPIWMKKHVSLAVITLFTLTIKIHL